MKAERYKWTKCNRTCGGANTNEDEGCVQEEEEEEKTVRSTLMIEEIANNQECQDTKDMVQWRSTSQEGIDGTWKELCGTVEEEVLEKCKVDEAKRVLIGEVVSRQLGGS